jgi:hypothetical protein
MIMDDYNKKEMGFSFFSKVLVSENIRSRNCGKLNQSLAGHVVNKAS